MIGPAVSARNPINQGAMNAHPARSWARSIFPSRSFCARHVAIRPPRLSKIAVTASTRSHFIIGQSRRCSGEFSFSSHAALIASADCSGVSRPIWIDLVILSSTSLTNSGSRGICTSAN
jgi:hypothetical protein